MKTSIMILAAFFFASISNAQAPTDFTGLWKIILMVSGGKPTPRPAYMIFNKDKSYLWGVDSITMLPMKSAAKGTWEITAEKEIKMTTEDKSEIRYYVPTGNGMYHYTYDEKDGNKVHPLMLEIDLFIKKVRDLKK